MLTWSADDGTLQRTYELEVRAVVHILCYLRVKCEREVHIAI